VVEQAGKRGSEYLMSTPQSLGPYQLVRQIASGGMAEIHLAKTTGLAGFEKWLVIKTIRESFSSDPEFIEMLVNEAKIAVRLNHANIVHIFDLGAYDGRHFIAMEYVEGHDLHALLVKTVHTDTFIPFDAVAYIIRETAAGLHYAHERCDEHHLPMGIIHRDMSPQNILISYDGEVKIADFGIAKASVSKNETQVGVLKGKFSYMSPEQAWGDKVDRRSDIFSLGVVLYESLVGEMLYHEEEPIKLLELVRRAQIPPPRSIRREVPAELEAIVMQALEPERRSRFQTAAELQHELSRYLAQVAPSYGLNDLATYVRSLFHEERLQLANVESATRRAPEISTRNVRIEVLGRDEYVPDAAMSLVHSVHHIKAIAQPATAKRAPAAQLAAARSPDDATRQLVLRAPQNVELPYAGAATHQALPIHDGLFDEDNEPTQAYTPDEIKKALSLAGAPGPTTTPQPNTQPPRGQVPQPQPMRAAVHPDISDVVPLASADLLAFNDEPAPQHFRGPRPSSQATALAPQPTLPLPPRPMPLPNAERPARWGASLWLVVFFLFAAGLAALLFVLLRAT